jgi:hypothetical protein
MNKESFIKELLDRKANSSNVIDLNAYASGLSKMLEELDKLPLRDFKSLFPKAFSKLTEDLESISLYINIDIENNNFSEEVAIKKYSKFAETYLNFGWVCTDLDRKQYGKKLDEGHYMFKEFHSEFAETYEDQWIEMDILLSYYDEDQINNHISSYYDSVDQIKELYGDEWEWIVAECIFEQESGLY